MYCKKNIQHIICIIICFFLSLELDMAFAQLVPKQDFPVEWVKYTFEEYLFDLEVASNERGLPESDFMKEMLNLAYGNLAKKVAVNVNVNSSMKKQAVNGQAQVIYNSNTDLSTDLSLKLVDSRTFYDAKKKEGYVIAFIEKAAALTYYQNEIEQILGKADKALRVSGDYILSGFKEKALNEINDVLPEFEKVDEIFFWLNSFGFSQEQQEIQRKQCIEKEQELKKRAAELKNATTIFIDCMVDLFGTPYTTLGKEIAGKIASEEYGFVSSRSDADWVITLRGSARRYNEDTPGKTTVYFSGVDVQINIDKIISAKRICEEEISGRSGHTISYEEAARLAYKELVPKIASIINNCIKD